MSVPSESNQEQLRCTVENLQGEVHEAARRLANAGHEAAQKLRDDFGLLREKTLGAVEHGREKTINAKHTLDERVRAEPVKSLLIAAAVGVAVGALFIRRR